MQNETLIHCDFEMIREPLLVLWFFVKYQFNTSTLSTSSQRFSDRYGASVSFWTVIWVYVRQKNLSPLSPRVIEKLKIPEHTKRRTQPVLHIKLFFADWDSQCLCDRAKCIQALITWLEGLWSVSCVQGWGGALSQRLRGLMGLLIEVSSMTGARWDCHVPSYAEK